MSSRSRRGSGRGHRASAAAGKGRRSRTPGRDGDSGAAASGRPAAGAARRAPARALGWLAPTLLLLAVVASAWFLVFRDSRAERVERIMKEAHEAMGTFEYSRAERLLLDAIEVLPEDPLLHHNLAVLYMRQDRLLDARPEFERAASLYEAESNEVRAEEYFQLALIDVQERKWQEAERHLELAIESHPMRPLLHLRLIDLQLSFLRLPARADSSTARFLRLCGRTPEHLRDAAYVHHQRSSFPTSIALAREAASAVDTMITAHVIAAKSYWKSGRIDEGLSYLEGPLARYVDSPELWVARGSLQIGGGRHEEALESIGKALEVDPQNYPAHLARLMALFNATRFEEALEQANHCKELTDNDEELRFLRAQIGRIRERMRGRDDDPPSYGREGASPGARP